MANALTIFKDKVQLPADLEDFFEEEANLRPKATVPSLSYSGKVWTVSINGTKTKMMKRGEEGDQEPVAVLPVVILNGAQNRGRAYYEGTFDPAKATMPECWSDDGIVPSPQVKNQKSPTCGTCPLSVKGSKKDARGKEVMACSVHRMLAVLPYGMIGKDNAEPLRLKIAVTSDYDPQFDSSTGWYPYRGYCDMLMANGVKHTAKVVTKIRFDPNVEYPKLVFSAARFLSVDEVRAVLPLVKSEKTTALISGTWTPNGVDGVKPTTEDDEALVPVETKKAVAPPPPPPEDDEDDDDVEAVAPAPAPAPVKKVVKPAPAPIAAEVVAEEDDDDGFAGLPEETPPPPSKVVRMAKPAPVVAKPVVVNGAKMIKGARALKDEPKPVTTPDDVSDSLQALIGDWGADD